MVRRALFLAVLLTSISMLSPGCSVKEDRGLCPAMLELQLPAGRGEVYVTLEGPEGEPVTHTAALQDEASQVTYPVSRNRFMLVVSTVPWEDNLVASRDGEEYPELYVYRTVVQLEGDALVVTPELRKEFCRLEVTIAPQQAVPSMEVSGAWFGQYRDGGLAPGLFRAEAVSGSTVCVPRQGDTSLMLDIFYGNLTRSFALGEYMAEAGYDWEATSLEDISVKIDFVSSQIQLVGSAWSRIFPIKIVL